MWKTFWFESNQFFDNVTRPEDWVRLRAAYPHMTDSDLLDAKEATYKGTRSQEVRDLKPNYGLRIEHDGERSLREFFKENNMLRLLPQ